LSDLLQPDAAAPDAPADRFYGNALERIKRCMLVIGAAATVVVGVTLGWQIGVGVLLGCMLAWVNFNWLKQAVSALADRATSTGQTQSSRGIVARFLLRYALIAVAAYAIFRVSKPSLYGLLGGLFLTVAAILCEAVYEAYIALRRGL
jgi:ATP synthase I chain